MGQKTYFPLGLAKCAMGISVQWGQSPLHAFVILSVSEESFCKTKLTEGFFACAQNDRNKKSKKFIFW